MCSRDPGSLTRIIHQPLGASPMPSTLAKYQPPRVSSARRRSPDLAETAERVDQIRQEMFLAAENLEFEKAARLRDDLRVLTEGGTKRASPTGSAAPAKKKKKKKKKRSKRAAR